MLRVPTVTISSSVPSGRTRTSEPPQLRDPLAVLADRLDDSRSRRPRRRSSRRGRADVVRRVVGAADVEAEAEPLHEHLRRVGDAVAVRVAVRREVGRVHDVDGLAVHGDAARAVHLGERRVRVGAAVPVAVHEPHDAPAPFTAPCARLGSTQTNTAPSGAGATNVGYIANGGPAKLTIGTPPAPSSPRGPFARRPCRAGSSRSSGGWDRAPCWAGPARRRRRRARRWRAHRRASPSARGRDDSLSLWNAGAERHRTGRHPTADAAFGRGAVVARSGSLRDHSKVRAAAQGMLNRYHVVCSRGSLSPRAPLAMFFPPVCTPSRVVSHHHRVGRSPEAGARARPPARVPPSHARPRSERLQARRAAAPVDEAHAQRRDRGVR